MNLLKFQHSKIDKKANKFFVFLCHENSAFIGPEASVIGIVIGVSFDHEPALASTPVIPPFNLFSAFVFTKENVIAPFAKTASAFGRSISSPLKVNSDTERLPQFGQIN